MTDDSIGPDELDAIEERAAAATPGPWLAVDYDGVHVLRSGGGPGSVIVMNDGLRTSTPANGSFIAAARSDVPRLAKTLREARAEAAQWKAKYDGLLIAMSPDQEAHVAVVAERDRLQAINLAHGEQKKPLVKALAEAEAERDAVQREWLEDTSRQGARIATLEAERDEARAQVAVMREAGRLLLESLGEYVRQSMHSSPEWRAGIIAMESVLRTPAGHALAERVRALEEVATAARLLADSMGLVNPLAPWGRLRDALVSALAKLDALRSPGAGKEEGK